MKRTEAHRRAEALIEALPYIQRFRGQTFVIKYGGSAMDDDDVVDRLLRDVVFLEAVGVNPVLVHGGGKAITGRMREAGIPAKFVNGLRVTDEASIRIVEDVLDGLINPKLVHTIAEFGGRARGFSGKSVLRARKLPPQKEGKGPEIDAGFVGEITGVELGEITETIHAETVPVISPLAGGEEGAVYNINADIAAGAIASGLRATKLVYLSDVPGIMRDPSQPESLIPSVNREMIAKLIEEEILAGGMLPKVDSAVRALEAGVSKVHFVDGRIPHSLLLEIFTTSGIGTEIVP
jgi:acetylglutamate kinase